MREMTHKKFRGNSIPPLVPCKLLIALAQAGRFPNSAAFIPTAGRYHLIANFDRWMISEMCAALWAGAIGVSFSFISFRDEHLAGWDNFRCSHLSLS